RAPRSLSWSRARAPSTPAATTAACVSTTQTRPPLAEDQVEVDNNRARWPCFFPSSVGLITVRGRDGRVGGMSCGSTTILARHPLTVAICVSYARINERYAPRGSLDLLDAAGRFGCGVPLYRSDVLSAITYLGNVSHRND